MTPFAFVCVLLVVPLLSCGPSQGGGGKVSLVAAENFWGSIAGQLGGDKVKVTSIIVNPDTDPHAYEAKPDDAKAFASAAYVIENGAGYDPWAQKLIDANPSSSRTVLDVGKLNGVAEGGNPHIWYSPSYILKTIDQITSDLKKVDEADSAYFDTQRSIYLSQRLEQYDDLRAQIKQRYVGTPVGASESIFAYLADDLGLKLLTPPDFMKAISEGSDPTAADKATADHQIETGQVKVFVFNSQNSRPDVQALVNKAKTKHIPMLTITETLAPANRSFQDWQTKQLQGLLDALGKARQA